MRIKNLLNEYQNLPKNNIKNLSIIFKKNCKTPFARKETSGNLFERTSSIVADKRLGRDSVKKELNKIKANRVKDPKDKIFKPKVKFKKKGMVK